MNVKGMCLHRSLNKHKLDQLIALAEREGVDVLAVQETWSESGEMDESIQEALRGYGWVWSGNTRRNQNKLAWRGSGGEGMLYRRRRGRVFTRGV